LAVCTNAFQKRARRRSHDVLNFQVHVSVVSLSRRSSSPCIFPRTTTFRARHSTLNVLRNERPHLAFVLRGIGHLHWFAAFHLSDFSEINSLVNSRPLVNRVEWVRDSLTGSHLSCYVTVVVVVKIWRLFPNVVVGLRRGTFNIGNLHDVASLILSASVFLRPSFFNVVYIHLVSDKLRRRDGFVFNFRKSVLRTERVGTSSRHELCAVRRGALNVGDVQVALWLVQRHVHLTRIGPVNVPVSIGELRFVPLLRTVQLWTGP